MIKTALKTILGAMIFVFVVYSPALAEDFQIAGTLSGGGYWTFVTPASVDTTGQTSYWYAGNYDPTFNAGSGTPLGLGFRTGSTLLCGEICSPIIDQPYTFRFFDGVDNYYFVVKYTGSPTPSLGWDTLDQPPATDGIATQTTPIASSTIGYDLNFTGTYNNALTYDHIVLDVNNLTDSSETGSIFSIPAISGSALPYNFTFTLQANRSFNYRLRLWDSVNNTYTAWTSLTAFSTTGVPTASIIDSTYITDNNCNITGINVDVGFTLDLSPLVNGACKVMVFLIYPSQDSLSSFSSLQGMVINKPPFAYFVQIKNALVFDPSHSDTFTLETVSPLTTNIFDPLRTGITWVLWVGFAFAIYKRSKHIEL